MANTAQSTDSSHLQAIPVRQTRRSVKPAHVKAAVIAKRTQGESISKISKDLGMTWHTTRGILKEANFDEQIEEGRIGCVKLIPQALRVAEHRLSQNSENMAIKVLENTIWPIQGKAGKGHDPSLTLAIQNLMLGPTQVNQPSTLHKDAAEASTNAEVKSAQVIDSKQDKP